MFGEVLGPRRRIVSVPFALKAEGEVPEGGIILGQTSGDPNILGLGYTVISGDTIGPYYLYQKDAYNPSSPRVPPRISYQGRVTASDGGTVAPSAELAFRLYDADTAGSVLWGETHTNVPLDDGLFSVELGSLNPVDPVDLVQKNLWLAVYVNGEELLPREKLTSAAYALKIESPVPPGGIVLSATNSNSGLAAKKFTLVAGPAVDGYYPYQKSAFSASDPSVPLLLNYQGRLRDEAGGLLDADTVDLHFSIYTTLSGSTLLWSETINDVPFDPNPSGIFSVLRGAVSPLTPATFPGPDAFLQVQVLHGLTTDTLSPRQRLTSVPFALQAEGTLPTSALILNDTTNNLDLLNAGFQMTGDTVDGYYIYNKTDIDDTPPNLTILAPEVYSGYTIASIPVTVTYSDSLSGIDAASFSAHLNGDTVTSSFAVSGGTATANLTAALGMNILQANVSDHAGNQSQKLTYFYRDSPGTPPVINIISPLDGDILYNNTPLVQVEFYDIEGGINFSTLSIKINGIDQTSQFLIHTAGGIISASWQIPYDFRLPDGPNQFVAFLENCAGIGAGATSDVTVSNQCLSPSIAEIIPAVGFPGNVVTINGTGFGSGPSSNTVYFHGGALAEVIYSSPTQLRVIVPPLLLSGHIEVLVDGKAAINPPIFTVGLRYGFVTNYDNPAVNPTNVFPSVAVIDFDSTPGQKKNQILRSKLSKPFDVDVSPDGSRAYITDLNGNKVYVINTSLADSSSSDLVGDTIAVPQPRYVKVSPDGLEVLVGSNNGMLYRIRNHRVLDSDPLGAAGGYVNEIAISPTLQKAYIAKSRGQNTAGEVYVSPINLDDPSSNQISVTKVLGTTYRNPTGVALKPNQTEVYVANNNSDGSGDANSFSILDASGISFKSVQGATIKPITDAHDVGHPHSMLFDPRGQLWYVTFSGLGAPGQSTNNVGMQKWLAASGDFHAATVTKQSTPHRYPHGIAVSPGGEWIFTAELGMGATLGNRLMILKHAKVKEAIDKDPGDTTYNLCQINPVVALDSNTVVNKYPGMFSESMNNLYDGPRNIAFQEFPIIELLPPVLHLALGGQEEWTNVAATRVHPVYGDRVSIGLDNGNTMGLQGYINTASCHPRELGQDRAVFTLEGPSWGPFRTLVPSQPGVGELIADVNGYPSNTIFVTVPPQKFIQVLFGEACPNTNKLTYRALAAVVKNRTRLTRGTFKKSWWGTDGQKFDFSPRLGHDLNDAVQVRASNASEKLVAEQLGKAFDHGYDCLNPEHEGAYNRYLAAAKRIINPVHMPEEHLWNYDMSVAVAGDAMLDLVRTLTDSDTVFDLTSHDLIPGTTAYDDPNYLDSYLDPTGGSFSFYSPSNTEWESNRGDGFLSIQEVLLGQTTDGPVTEFPNAGDFEVDTICGGTPDCRAQAGMLCNFCQIDSNRIRRARNVQVVVIDNIPLNYNECGGVDKNIAPQFIFLRFRENSKRSVVRGP